MPSLSTDPQLRGLCRPSSDLPAQEGEDIQQGRRSHYIQQVHAVQAPLYFRNVSFASDEPLCLMTLLSLDPTDIITAGPCRQERMAKVWKLVAEKCGGHLRPG